MASDRHSHRPSTLLLPAVIGVVVALLAIALWFRPGPDLEASKRKSGEQMAALWGMNQPVRNALAAEFVDADGDLVADAPADVSRQLDPPELTFTYIASDPNTRDYPTIFRPLMDELSRATGKPVRYLPLADTNEQATALREGRLHVCVFNTGAVPAAVDSAGFVPVAVVGDASGASRYSMQLLAAAGSGITEPSQLKNRELVLTEPSSNSGAKAPLIILRRDFNMLPNDDYVFRFSGGHVQSIAGLASGKYQVVAVASDVLARAEAAGQVGRDQFRVIYRSTPFPTACYGYAHQLKPELAGKIREALLGVSFAGNPLGEFYARSGQTRLVATHYADDFRFVREIDDTFGEKHQLKRTVATTQSSQ